MADESIGSGHSRGIPSRSVATAIDINSNRSKHQAIEAQASNETVSRGREVNTALRTRPDSVTQKSGEGGKRVSLVSNYFRLCSPRNAIVYDYRVDFEPNVELTKVRKAMLYKHKTSFGDCMIFDGMSNVKSTVLLPKDETEFLSTRSTDNVIIRITVRRGKEIPWHHMEMMRLYNTQMRRNLQSLQLNLIGRNYFDLKKRYAIPEHRLEVIKGMQTAINRYEDGDVLMMCNTVNKVIRTDTVLQHMSDILSRNRASFKDKTKKEIIGKVVITKYNNRTYRIDDIDFDNNPMTKFDYRNEGQITLKDYYLQQYNIGITDEKQPLLIVRPNIRQVRAGQVSLIYLIPELCIMTGLSESLKNDFTVRRALTHITQLNPNTRVAKLNEFLQSLNSNPEIKKEMSAWKLELSPSLVEIPARVMDCEKIVMANNFCTEFHQKTGEFMKEIRGKPMFAGITITDWVVIVSQRDRHFIDDFANTLNRVCRPMDVHLSRPPLVHVINDDSTASYLSECRYIPPSTQIVVVILSDDNKERYDAIKKYFCCEQPIASQMVVARSISRKQLLMTVCTKIGIQMACKLGAQPWALDIPPKDVMIVGFTVHSDSAQCGKSVGGFVSSTNATFTQWYSRASFHFGREQMSNNFSVNFIEGLKRYHVINKKLPSIVIIYRDGVSEGEIAHVFDYELPQIQTAIENEYREQSQTIKLTFIIVNKDNNSRFFLRSDKTFVNPEPGTVVDTVVTREERYDFYLTSQRNNSVGTTATPTMYNIIKDETNWLPQNHQQLAFKLCHLYYNWTGTIRVPAPCYYAHKLAYLTEEVLHRLPHNRLSDKLFYL